MYTYRHIYIHIYIYIFIYIYIYIYIYTSIYIYIDIYASSHSFLGTSLGGRSIDSSHIKQCFPCTLSACIELCFLCSIVVPYTLMGLRFVPHEAFLPPELTLTICSCALGHLKLGSHYDLQLSTNLRYITMHHNLATLARFRLDAGSMKRLLRSLIHENIYTIKAKFVILSQCLAL